MQFHIFIIEIQYWYTSIVQKFEKKIHNTGTNFYTSDRQVQEIPKPPTIITKQIRRN
jgi:hypothetical protein